MKAVIFDLDGTLADTSGDLIAAGNTCFKTHGLGDVLDFELDRSISMKGIRRMLKGGFERANTPINDDMIEEYYRATLRAYADNIDTYTTLYTGVASALSRLQVAGFKLGVCTNKPVRLAQTLLNRLGIDHNFGSVIGDGSLDVLKPSPRPLLAALKGLNANPAKSVLIGDTVTDLETARGAKIAIILVTFGPDGHEVAKLRPDALLDDYGSVLGVVERMLIEAQVQ